MSWPEGFPDIGLQTTVVKLTSHPDYKVAKAGDTEAAIRTVESLIKPEKIKKLAETYPDAEIIPVRAVEQSGRNKLPLVYAHAISDLTGLKVNRAIHQTNVSAHTGASALTRFANRATFEGEIKPGQKYILVDDVVAQGGTLGALRAYIESAGGKVVAVTTLAASKPYSVVLAQKQKTAKRLVKKFGADELRRFLHEQGIAGSYEGLTESEAKYLLSFASLDALRTRLAKEGHGRVLKTSGRPLQTSIGQVGGPYAHIGEQGRGAEDIFSSTPEQIATIEKLFVDHAGEGLRGKFRAARGQPTAEQQQAVETARALGLTPTFFEIDDPDFSDNLGGFMWRAEPDKIYLNAKSLAPATYVVVHESTHSLSVRDPETFLKLRGAIWELITDSTPYQDWLHNMRDALGLPDLGPGKFGEEFIGNLAATLLTNTPHPAKIDQLVRDPEEAKRIIIDALGLPATGELSGQPGISLSLTNKTPLSLIRSNSGEILRLFQEAEDAGKLIKDIKSVLESEGLKTDPTKTILQFYKVIRGKENIVIAPSVRAELDRMLETEEARAANPIYQMLDSYDSLPRGHKEPSPEALQTFEQVQAEASRQAELAIAETEAKMRKRYESQLRKEAKAIFPDIPEISVAKTLSKGGIRASSLTDYDADTVKEFMRRWPGLVKKTGKHEIDVAAADWGYESGDQLFYALKDVPTLKQFTEGYVTAGVRANEDHFALSASERLGMIIEKEGEIIAKLMGQSTADWANVARGMAAKDPDEITGTTKVGSAMISEYHALISGMAKAEKAARVAYRAGQKDRALIELAKRKAALDLYRAKIQARADTRKAVSDIQKVIASFKKDPKLGREYIDAIVHLLEPLGPPLGLKLPQLSGKFSAPLVDAIRRAKDAGFEFPMEPDDIYKLRSTSWKDLDVDDLKEIATACKIFLHFARVENKMISIEAKEAFNTIIDGLVLTGLSTARGRGAGAPTTVAEKIQAKAAKETKLSFLSRYLFSLKRTEFINRDLDGWKFFGPHYTYMDRILQKAVQQYNRMANEIKTRYEADHKRFEAAIGMSSWKWFSQKVNLPGWPRPITRDMMMMAWASTLNAENMKTLRKMFSPAQINWIRANITQPERDLMLAHMDHFESFRPLLGELSIAMWGVEPKWVKGKYWPIKIDPDLEVSSEILVAKSATEDLFKSSFDCPNVPSPFMKARKGTGRPVDLSYSWILPRMLQQARWLSLAKPIRDYQRIVSDKRWMDMVVRTRGRLVYDQYMGMLQDLANPSRLMAFNPAQILIDRARRVTVAHALCVSINTCIKHFSEWMLSVEKLGFFNCLRGFVSFYSHPVENFNFINEISSQMRYSHQSIDRDLADFQAAIQGFKPWQRAFLNHGMDLLLLADRGMRYPIFLEALHQGVEGRAAFDGAPIDQEKAVEFAEQIVRLTKPVSGAENLPTLFRGPGFGRLITTFGTYFNGVMNVLWEMFSRLKYDPSYNFWDFSKAFFLMMIVTPMLTDTCTKKRLPEGPGEAALWIANYWASIMPGVNQIVSTAIWGFELAGKHVQSRGVTGTEFINASAQVMLDMMNWGTGSNKLDEYWWVNLLDAIGTIPTSHPMGGFPPRQAITAAKGAYDLWTGKTDTYWSLIDRGAMYEGRVPGAKRTRRR